MVEAKSSASQFKIRMSYKYQSVTDFVTYFKFWIPLVEINTRSGETITAINAICTIKCNKVTQPGFKFTAKIEMAFSQMLANELQ